MLFNTYGGVLKDFKTNKYTPQELHTPKNRNKTRVLFSKIPQVYEYLCPIGIFGESVVYKAKYLKTDNIVIVKFPFSNLGKPLTKQKSKVKTRKPGIDNEQMDIYSDVRLNRSNSLSMVYKNHKMSRGMEFFKRSIDIQNDAHYRAKKFKGIGYVPAVFDHPFYVEEDKPEEFQAFIEYKKKGKIKYKDPGLIKFCWVVYEYVEAQTAQHWAEGKSDFRKIKVLAKMCHFLWECFHKEKFMHSDISDKNIMIKEFQDRNGDMQDEVILIDFSYSKNPLWHIGHSVSEDVRYNPVYSAPEQKDNYIARNYKSDIWSIGILMHNIITENFPGLRGDPRQNQLHLFPPQEIMCPDLREIFKKATRQSDSGNYEHLVQMSTDIAKYLQKSYQCTIDQVNYHQDTEVIIQDEEPKDKKEQEQISRGSSSDIQEAVSEAMIEIKETVEKALREALPEVAKETIPKVADKIIPEIIPKEDKNKKISQRLEAVGRLEKKKDPLDIEKVLENIKDERKKNFARSLLMVHNITKNRNMY